VSSIASEPRGRKRILALLIGAVVTTSLALVAVRSYSQMMHNAPDSSHSLLKPESWPDSSLTIANLGHATVLMNFFGTRVLADPSLFSRVGLSFDSIFTIGPKRVTDPPLAPAQLQHIDLILITHAHMDHLDIPSLKALPKSAVVVACDKCSALIASLGFKDVRELKWGESTTVDGVMVRAMGARHWGKRWPPFGEDYGFNSYVLEKNGRRVLLACDSADTDLFSTLASTPPDVAIFSVGAYDPWIWNHANPEQVWSMFESTGARYLIPIHWGTFRLGKEPLEEPMQRLIAAAGDQQDRIVLRQIGASWTMPASIESRQAAGR
jgi:L-ascorbate metabolism protein UlaG (beta-lactamase superfamily)